MNEVNSADLRVQIAIDALALFAPGKHIEAGRECARIIRERLDALAAERDALREEVADYKMAATAEATRSDRLSAECARLREDVARLDWLTAHIDNGGSFDGLGFDHEDWDDSIEWSDCGKDEPTFRDLIDAARTEDRK